MLITRESLLRLARETVSQRIHAHPELVAVYLTGSLLTDDPLLGNTTDIDLVFVHPYLSEPQREVVPLTAEVHLDIKINPRFEYEHPRQLRLDPWLGPEMYAPLRLYDGQHFFDFVQAGVRDKYDDPANAWGRAHRNLEHARDLWSDLRSQPPAPDQASPQRLLKYMKAVSHACNCLAVLQGRPLAERRFLTQFRSLATVSGHPELAASLLRLLGADRVDASSLASLLPSWEADFLTAGSLPGADPRLHPGRCNYYLQGMRSQLQGAFPLDLLWPLLYTWSLAVAGLTTDARHPWDQVCHQWGLEGEYFAGQLDQLDAFLDQVTAILDALALANGL